MKTDRMMLFATTTASVVVILDISFTFLSRRFAIPAGDETFAWLELAIVIFSIAYPVLSAWKQTMIDHAPQDVRRATAFVLPFLIIGIMAAFRLLRY